MEQVEFVEHEYGLEGEVLVRESGDVLLELRDFHLGAEEGVQRLLLLLQLLLLKFDSGSQLDH